MNDHIHKYFIYQVKADFEPLLTNPNRKPLYSRVEYAYAGCNCGAAIRTKVEEMTDDVVLQSR